MRRWFGIFAAALAVSAVAGCGRAPVKELGRIQEQFVALRQEGGERLRALRPELEQLDEMLLALEAEESDAESEVLLRSLREQAAELRPIVALGDRIAGESDAELAMAAFLQVHSLYRAMPTAELKAEFMAMANDDGMYREEMDLDAMLEKYRAVTEALADPANVARAEAILRELGVRPVMRLVDYDTPADLEKAYNAAVKQY